MIPRFVSFLFTLIGSLAGVVFLAALSGYRNLHCWETPANQCADAAGTMWMMVPVFMGSVAATLWLWRGGWTHA